MKVYVVFAFRMYGDSWVADVFDSQEKANVFIKSKKDKDEDKDDPVMMISYEYEVK